jgi:outer membrane lipoprotein SlyB
MRSATLKLFALLSLSMILSACTSKPILQPNKKYQRVGHERSEQDIDICLKQADKQLEKTQARRTMRGAAIGAVAGGAVGALSGSSGHVGTLGGAALGAGGGAVGGALIGRYMTPQDAKRSLVNYCLKQKGYEVAGWDD